MIFIQSMMKNGKSKDLKKFDFNKTRLLLIINSETKTKSDSQSFEELTKTTPFLIDTKTSHAKPQHEIM